MNSLRIVKNAEGVNGVMLSNQCVLMIEDSEEKLLGFTYQRYYMYNLEKNTKIEIAPNIPKLNIIKITDINKHPKFIYFSNFDNRENGTVEIRIFRYSIEDKICKKIYSIEDDFEKYDKYQITRVFVLNEFYMIIQNEMLRSNLSESYESYLDFELFMFNILQNETIKVVDENMSSNGISDIKLISENICVIKTGFSLLKEQRFKKLEKDEVSVEGISVVNLGQLVSDIIISKNNIVMDTIVQTFYTDTIPYIKVNGEYLVYSKYNFEQNEETVVFYNYATKESQVCLNKNESDNIKLANTIIFNHKPYLKVETTKGIEFYNVEAKKTDFIFSSEDKFETAINDIIIGTNSKKGMFGRKKAFINVYKYPGLSLVHREKAKYLGCILGANGTLYILIKKG